MKTMMQTAGDSTLVPVIDFSEEIDRGVERLDERLPGWEQVVDLSKVDMKNTQACVCGQVFRSSLIPEDVREFAATFSGKLDYLGIGNGQDFGFDLSVMSVQQWAFDAGVTISPSIAWSWLAEQWIDRIKQLRAERAVL